MKEKLNQIPLPVIIGVALALLGFAGYMTYRTVEGQNGSYMGAMDRGRYQEEMKKRAGGGQYSASGQPGSRGSGGGNQQMMERMRGGRGGMQGGGMQGGGMQGGGQMGR